VNTDHPQIPESLVRSVLLEILATALKRWRYEGTGPDYAEIEGLGCATIFLFFLGSSGGTHGYLPGPQWRKLMELFKKKDSKFYWYDFKVRSGRQEESRKDCCCVRFR
jgi:hypothetical protein